MKDKLVTVFIYLAGGLLFATALGKVFGAGGGDPILDAPDPLLMLSRRNLLLAVGVLELVVAGFALFGQDHFLRSSLIAWLATNFLVYRIGLWWIGIKSHCFCLGTVSTALALSPVTVDWIMRGIAVFLLVGGYLAVFTLWRQGKRVESANNHDVAVLAGHEQPNS